MIHRGIRTPLHTRNCWITHRFTYIKDLDDYESQGQRLARYMLLYRKADEDFGNVTLETRME